MKALLLLPAMIVITSCTTHLGPRTGTPSAAVKVARYTLRKDVIYTPKSWPQAIPADVYQPVGTGPWPGVLLIHGGSWTTKDRRSDMDSIAERLARRGYVVMNATYRLAPKHPHPAQVQDLQQAIAWMRAHATELHLRSDRLATFGYSAGGHLSALLGSVDAPARLRVQAVVAGGAPSDLRKWPNSRDVVGLLGGPMAEVPRQYADASPVTHISRDDPPVFLYHGGLDQLVPVDQAADYHTALNAGGVPNELLWQRGRGHVPAFFLDGDAVRPAIDFLDRHLRR